MGPDGLRAEEPLRVVGGMAVAATIPLDEITAAAERDDAPNARDDRGTTALMLASVRDDPSFMQPLLDAGAAVNTRDTLGRTALMVAAESSRGEVEKVRMLLKAGADVTIRDSEGRTVAERMRNCKNAELLGLLSIK